MEHSLSWLNEPYLLNENLPFKIWQDETNYTKAYYVSPNGCDHADGSLEHPFRTVKRANELVQPGEKVILRGGIYRETIRPLRGGIGKDAMIAYEAYPGEEVQVTGLRPYAGEYTPNKLYRSLANRKDIFRLSVLECIEDGYNPFAMTKMPHDWCFIETFSFDKMRPFFLPRGQILVDGEVLPQAADMNELARMEKGMWAEANGRFVNIKWVDDGLPAHRVELIMAEELFAPVDYGMAYIAIRGIHFHGCANGYPMPQNGAVSAMRGHHFIVEDCRFSLVNGIALEVGIQCWNSAYENAIYPKTVGHLVRRNYFTDIGVCGIASFLAEDMLVEDNILDNVCTAPVEYMAEDAAIKLHWTMRCLIRGNRISNTPHGAAVWLDYANRDCRISENHFINIRSNNGGIVYEANRAVCVTDNNIFMHCTSVTSGQNAGGLGVMMVGSEFNEVYHNFFWDCRGAAFFTNAVLTRIITPLDGRIGGGRGGTGRKNTVIENIFGGAGRALVEIAHEDNNFEGNIYAPKRFNTGYIRIGTSDSPYKQEEVDMPNLRMDLEGFQTFFEKEASGQLSGMNALYDAESASLQVTCTDKEISLLQAILPFRNAVIDQKENQYILTLPC